MDYLDKIIGVTSSAYNATLAERTAKQEANAAAANARAASAGASASILSSRNMIIAAVVLVLGIGAFLFFKRK